MYSRQFVESVRMRNIDVLDTRAMATNTSMTSNAPSEDLHLYPKEWVNDATNIPQQAVYCVLCEMWLGDAFKYQDHRVGKKHRKNQRKVRAQERIYLER